MPLIEYLIPNNYENEDILNDLSQSLYSIFYTAQQNNDNLVEIVEIHFSLINEILKVLIPNHEQKNDNIFFYCIKCIGILLTGYDQTSQVSELLYIFKEI